jgi:hypothetical protein
VVTLIGIASEMEDPYRPRFVDAHVPDHKLPETASRPSRFDGGVAIAIFVMCAALPIVLLIAAMCHHGKTP